MLVNPCHHILFRNHLAINPDAFPEVGQMWRGIQSGFISGSLKNRGQHMGHRSLAISTGNVDGPEAPVGKVKILIELMGGVQISFIGSLSDSLIHRKLSK